jgi:eukaryotic-like serine/threonine-protein kinase
VTNVQARLAEALADRYAIEDEVGAGGMATVYRARDLKHDRVVALKVLRPELSAALGGERFPREIRIVAQLNHPHILSLYDSGEAAGLLYYVMPFAEGETLADRIAREGRLPVPDVVRILRDVSDALAYSHARGVVHRDIKPGNVMLSGRHATVADFGVAKAISASSADRNTTVGMAVGTPVYMSPEQATGQGDIDARADLYALGILGYEMLAGRPPFSADTPQAILSAHVLEPPKDIRLVRQGTPPALADALMRCLAKDPADRWQHADDLVAFLEALPTTPSGGMTPTDTRPVPGVGRPARKWPIAAYVGSAVAILASVVAIVVATSNRARGDEPTRIERLAVMPIEDLSGQDKVFATAMHDALATAMAKLGRAEVTPRSATLRYADGATPLKQVAEELRADAMIEATLFRAGDKVRITVQLSDPRTATSLWSDTFERDASDVLAAQDEIVQRITAGVDSLLAGSASGARE